jgi:hypothetical protein
MIESRQPTIDEAVDEDSRAQFYHDWFKACDKQQVELAETRTFDGYCCLIHVTQAE